MWLLIRRMLVMVTFVSGLGATALSPFVDVAQAAPPAELACGDVVDTDAIMVRDLSCSGAGITVIASGVTVDLRGYRLSGDGTGIGVEVVTDDRAPVTITRGTISDFGVGIQSAGSVSMDRVTVARSSFGLGAVGRSKANTIKLSILKDNGHAVLASLGRLSITETKFVGNLSAVRMGSRNASITHSTFVANDGGILAHQSDGHTIAHNLFRGNARPILLSQSRHNEIVQNRVVDNDNGLFLHGPESQGNVITGNAFIGNKTYGAKVGDGRFSLLTGTEIADNMFARNGAAGLWFQSATSADGSRITGNIFRANGFTPGSIVDEDETPLDDGLHVFNSAKAGTVTLTDNLAIRNAGHGIQASNVVDGGGNLEVRNGAGSGLTP